MLLSGNQCSLEKEIFDTSCPNCFVLKEQLETVTQELKTARTIISLLKEEVN
jgi:predicted DsbA family dithiol-disulfide isomerase